MKAGLYIANDDEEEDDLPNEGGAFRRFVDRILKIHTTVLTFNYWLYSYC